MRYLPKLTLCLLFLTIPISQGVSQTEVDSLMKKFEKFRDNSNSDEVDLRIDSLTLKEIEYTKAVISYYENSLEIRKSVFTWNHESSKIIFWMVLSIVFFGLCFSTIQFYIGMLQARHKAKLPSPESGESKNEKTGLKLSLSGIEVNSSVLGVIILVISLAFFYLYLIYVYPVKEYRLDQQKPTMNQTY